MRSIFTVVFCLGLLLGAQALAQPCCGSITPEGRRLDGLLGSSGLDHLWQPHIHVNWQTGVTDPARPSWSKHVTHCSAYAAAMAERVGVYLLRPPFHGQSELANAQFNWLAGVGRQAGWREVTALTAQRLANQGYFVLAVYANPTPHKPGHVAIIKPSTKSLSSLRRNGPEEAQAGLHNYIHTTISHGFAAHKGAWVSNGKGSIRFFAHAVCLGRYS